MNYRLSGSARASRAANDTLVVGTGGTETAQQSFIAPELFDAGRVEPHAPIRDGLANPPHPDPLPFHWRGKCISDENAGLSVDFAL